MVCLFGLRFYCAPTWHLLWLLRSSSFRSSSYHRQYRLYWLYWWAHRRSPFNNCTSLCFRFDVDALERHISAKCAFRLHFVHFFWNAGYSFEPSFSASKVVGFILWGGLFWYGVLHESIYWLFFVLLQLFKFFDAGLLARHTWIFHANGLYWLGFFYYLKTEAKYVFHESTKGMELISIKVLLR